MDVIILSVLYVIINKFCFRCEVKYEKINNYKCNCRDQEHDFYDNNKKKIVK